VPALEEKLGLPGLFDALAHRLSASDLNTLLTQVFAERATRQTPQQLLRSYEANQYAQPSPIEPIAYRALELATLEAARERGSTCLILSPAAAFGCCSAFGCVDQKKVVSATRGLEVLSDATNMVALHIARGLRDGTISRDDGLAHFCTTHRHLRVDSRLGPGRTAHFGLFAQVSSGKAQSGYGFERQAMGFHVGVVRDILSARHVPFQIVVNRRLGYKDGDGFFTAAIDHLRADFPDVPVQIDEQPNTTGYYLGLRAVFRVHADGRDIDLGDLGFTDWTRRLLNKKSERLCISSLALDRLLQLTAEQR